MRVDPGPHTVPGTWGLLQSVPVAGVALRWFRDAFCAGLSYDQLSELAAQVPAGSEGLLFVTAAVGGGGFHFGGARLSHGRGHFARAIMEGIVCRVRQCLENLESVGAPPKRLVMIGGGARSSVWPRIVADLSGVRTDLPEVSEAACRGAAILGGIAAGVFRDFDDAQRRFTSRPSTVPTSAEHRATYEALYARFNDYVEQLGLGCR
jgi:xylulokinase